MRLKWRLSALIQKKCFSHFGNKTVFTQSPLFRSNWTNSHNCEYKGCFHAWMKIRGSQCLLYGYHRMLSFLVQWRIPHFFASTKSWLSSLWSQAHSPIHVRVHPDTSISCHSVNKHQWPGSPGSHTFLFVTWPSPFLTDDVLLSKSFSFPSPDSFHHSG